MEIECGAALRLVRWNLRIEKRQSPEARWNQRGPGALAEAKKEVAPAEIDGWKRLLRPGQNNFPCKFTVWTETNICDFGRSRRRIEDGSPAKIRVHMHNL